MCAVMLIFQNECAILLAEFGIKLFPQILQNLQLKVLA